MNTTTPTDDNEYARYLASYLFEHQDDFIVCTDRFVDFDELYKVICKFESTRI